MGNIKSNYGLATYGAILAVFLFAVIGPQFAYIQYTSELILGMGTMLIVYTLGLILFGRLETLKEFNIGLKGVSGVTKDLARQAITASEITRKPPSEEAKKIVNEIREAESNPSAVFIDLTGQIERRLNDIYEEVVGWESKVGQPITARRYIPVPKLVNELVKLGFMPINLGALIRDFLGLRNKIIHGESFTANDLTNAVEIGTIVMSELDRMEKTPT